MFNVIEYRRSKVASFMRDARLATSKAHRKMLVQRAKAAHRRMMAAKASQ